MGGQTLKFNQTIFDTKRTGIIKRRFVLRFQHITGAGLQFACGVFVDTIDDQQLVDFDEDLGPVLEMLKLLKL